MKKKVFNLGIFEPLKIDKVSQYAIKGGNTYDAIGSSQNGTASTIDWQRDDGRVACSVNDAWSPWQLPESYWT